MMKTTALIAAMAVLTPCVASAQAAAAKRCPADARAASFAVWGASTIRTGMTVTGRHPCGRTLECIGGRSDQRATRQCRWR